MSKLCASFFVVALPLLPSSAIAVYLPGDFFPSVLEVEATKAQKGCFDAFMKATERYALKMGKKIEKCRRARVKDPDSGYACQIGGSNLDPQFASSLESERTAMEKKIRKSCRENVDDIQRISMDIYNIRRTYPAGDARENALNEYMWNLDDIFDLEQNHIFAIHRFIHHARRVALETDIERGLIPPPGDPRINYVCKYVFHITSLVNCTVEHRTYDGYIGSLGSLVSDLAAQVSADSSATSIDDGRAEKCADAIVRASNGMMKTVLKKNRLCLTDAMREKGCETADGAGDIDEQKAKLLSKLAKKCDAAVMPQREGQAPFDLSVLEFPDPAYAGASGPLVSFAQFDDFVDYLEGRLDWAADGILLYHPFPVLLDEGSRF